MQLLDLTRPKEKNLLKPGSKFDEAILIYDSLFSVLSGSRALEGIKWLYFGYVSPQEFLASNPIRFYEVFNQNCLKQLIT